MAMTLAVVGDGDYRAATFVAASTVAEMTLVMPVLAVEVALVHKPEPRVTSPTQRRIITSLDPQTW